MKEGIHPNYQNCVIKCACGETFESKSIKPELRVETCSKCHPFYTGSQKNTVVGGRSERFKKKFNIKDED